MHLEITDFIFLLDLVWKGHNKKKINGYKILIVKEGFDEEYLCSDGSVLS